MNIFEKKRIKLLSVAIAIAFSWNQISPLYAQSSLQNLIAPSPEDNQQIQTITPSQAKARQAMPSASGQIVSPGVANSQDFVSAPPVNNQETQDQEQKEKDNQKLDQIKDAYELERYSFDEARDLLRPEFASAVVLKDISAKDMQELLNLPMEVGFAILDDELVMFSSGSQSEIDVVSSARKMLQNAELIIHTHPDNHAITQPSGEDIQQAGALTEYVISRDGVYGYNHSGLKNNGDAYSYQFLVNEINRRLALDRLNGTANEISARQKLNDFIHQMDLMNQANPADRKVFRSGAVIAPNSNLGPGNLTALPVQPDVMLTSGSSAGSSANQPSSSTVHLNYALGTVGSFAGVTLNYDNFGTQNVVESQNLSNVQSIVFGMSSNAYQVKVEFVDANNNKDYFLLTGVLSSTRYYQIDLNLLGPNVDRSKIAQINFIVDRNGTMPANYYGTLDLTFASLNVTGLQNADPTLTAANVTKLPGTVQPVLVGKLIDGTTTLAQPDNAHVNLAYNLQQNDSFAAAVFSFDNFATPNTVETVNLLAQGYPNNEIIVGLTGPAGATVRVEFEDITSTAANPHKDYLNLGPLSGGPQFFRLKLNNLSGIDLTKIKGINFVMDRFTVAPLDGVLTAANRQGNLAIQFAAGLDVTGLQNADPTKTVLDVTSMPNVPRVPVAILTGGSNAAGASTGSFIRQISPNQVDLTYDIRPNGTYAGITINYDDFGTNPAIETQDISKLANNQIIVGLSGTPGSAVRVEFVDITGNKDSLLVGPLAAGEQFYPLKMGLLTGVDLTKIRFVNFIVDQYAADTINGIANRQGVLHLRLNGLTYTPTVVPNASLTAANLTQLPTGQAILTGGSSANSAIALVSSSEIGLNYDVTANGSFSGAGIAFDDFNTLPIETQDLSSLTNLVVGIRGHNAAGGDRVRVELVDAAGVKSSVLLDNVNDTEKFYSIPTSLFAGANLTKVRMINFIVDKDLVTDPTNVIHVRVRDLSQPTLTAQQQTIRQNLISNNLKYFQVGVGIDPVTHFPYDNISATAVPQSFTQPTAIGFYLQMLADMSNGLMPSGFLTSSQALTEANTVLTNLASAQTNFGWKGLLPFLNLSPLAPSTTIVGFGDNANLAQSLAVFIGGLLRGTYSASDQAVVNGLIAKANTILANMAPGFNAMIDPTFNIFHNSVDTDTGQFISYNDRLGNEFRADVAFIVSFYGINRAVWDNMVATTRNYTDSNGTAIQNLSPFDGGAFQIFWPLLRTNEQKLVEMLPALKNALYTFADFAKRNNIPGFVSASSTPENGYRGLQGVINIAEINPNVLVFDIGSLYAIAAAFSVDPDFVIYWLDNIRAQFPALSGPFGLFDSARSQLEMNQHYYAIDQSSIVLGLADNGGNDFDAFLANRGLTGSYQGLYESLSLNITPTTQKLPNPPTVPARTFTVLNNFSSEGITGTFPFQPTDITGLVFNYSNQTQRQGHYWMLNQVHDARGETIRLKYTVTTSPQSLEVELVDAANNRLGLYTVPIAAGSGVQESDIQLPNIPALKNVAQVRVILNPPATGVQSANFKLNQFTFVYLGSPVNLQPDGTLTAANVTTLAGNPALIKTGGSTAASSITQQSASQFDLNFNNAVQGNYSGATITFDNFSTPAVEAVDISALPQLVFGISSSVATPQTKIELVDANGVKATFNILNIGTTQQFWAIDVTNLPPGFDRTKLRFINFIVDSTNTGILSVTTGGLLFTTYYSPNSALTAANVNTLPSNFGLVTTGGSVLGTSVYQISPSQFGVTINNQTAGNFGGGSVTFDNFGTPAVETQDLSTMAQYVFGLSSPQFTQAKVEFIDVNGNRGTFNLTGISPTEKFWSLNLGQLPTGVDRTKIKLINFIVDTQAQGILNVRTAGLAFTPLYGPDATLTLAQISSLPGLPDVVITGGSAAGTTISFTGSTQFGFTVNNQSVGQYGGATVTFDNFSTPAVETQNLTMLLPELIVGVSGTLPTAKVELIDVNNVKATFNLTGIDANQRFWRLPLTSLPAGFQLNAVKFINVINDTLGSGSLTVRLAGLNFITAVAADPTLTLAQVSTLNSPSPTAILTFGSAAGSRITQPSASEINVTYNLTTAGQYSGATLNFDNFTTPAIESINLSAQTNLILGLKATPNLVNVKLELIDAAGTAKHVLLSAVTGSEQFWRVPLVNFAGVDLAHVRYINVIADQAGSGNFTLRVNGQQFTPSVTPDATLTVANITNLPNFPIPGLTGGSSATSIFTRVSSSQMNVNYDVTAAGSFSGATLTYGSNQDLSTLSGNRLVFGVRRTGTVSGTIRVKLELVDANGMRATVFIDSVTSNPSIYAVPFSVLPVGFDITKVSMLSWIVDQNGVTVPTQTGTIEVNINGIA